LTHNVSTYLSSKLVASSEDVATVFHSSVTASQAYFNVSTATSSAGCS
jgi:hypothetical protein